MNAYLKTMGWSKFMAVAIFVVLILVTVIGNMLVILSVLTTRRLRTVTNCFVMNLAVADLLVGILVMPPAVILHVIGSWQLGRTSCDIWIFFDIMLCTASILSLCAISLDRYLAVTQPLTYSKKWRCKRLAMLMILGVWLLAFVITCPPLFGWHEPDRSDEQQEIDCRYNQNKGYVVYSAMGSFFIPLTVMLYVYVRIGYVLTSRRQRIVRDADMERTADNLDVDGDNFISESEQYRCHNPQKCLPCCDGRCIVLRTHANPIFNTQSVKCNKCRDKGFNDKRAKLKHQPTFYELMEISRISSLAHCTSNQCCYHNRRGSSMSVPALNYNESQSYASTSLDTPNTASVDRSHPSSQRLQRPLASHRITMRISTKTKNTKTTKTLTIVMGGLIACWTPFFVYYLLAPFLPQLQKLQGIMSVFTWVGWVNCAINPFIYAFNPDFRAAFWRLTCRRICKQKFPRNHMNIFRA